VSGNVVLYLIDLSSFSAFTRCGICSHTRPCIRSVTCRLL